MSKPVDKRVRFFDQNGDEQVNIWAEYNADQKTLTLKHDYADFKPQVGQLVIGRSVEGVVKSVNGRRVELS